MSKVDCKKKDLDHVKGAYKLLAEAVSMSDRAGAAGVLLISTLGTEEYIPMLDRCFKLLSLKLKSTKEASIMLGNILYTIGNIDHRKVFYEYLESKDKLADLLDLLSELISKYPKDPYNFLEHGNALSKSACAMDADDIIRANQLRQQAIARFKKAIKLFKGIKNDEHCMDSDFTIMQLYGALGINNTWLEKYLDAENALKAAVMYMDKISPTSATLGLDKKLACAYIYTDLALVQFKLQRGSSAEDMLKLAYDICPDAQMLHDRGMVFESLGAFNLAVSSMELAGTIDPQCLGALQVMLDRIQSVNIKDLGKKDLTT